MNKKVDNKALFFVNSLVGGGAEQCVLNLCEQCNNNKIKPVVVSLYNQKAKIPNYIDHYCLNIKRNNNILQAQKICTLGNLLKSNQTWNKFLTKYANYKFKLISAHLPMSHKLAILSPFSNKTIYVFHLSLDIVPKLFRPIHNNILKRTYNNKFISCVSNGIKNELNKIVNPKQAKTIYNPIKAIKTNTKKPDKPYILMAGRLTKMKNHSKAIQLFIKSKLYKDYDLVIAGVGPLYDKLQKEIDKNQMHENIKLIGYKDNLDQLISNASLLLSTSTNEGFGMILAEALILNTPVVTTNCKYGPSEILTGKLKKYLIPLSANDNEYIRVINSALNGNYPNLSNEISKKFDPNRILNEYINYYSLAFSSQEK